MEQIKELFYRNHPLLVRFANTKLGRKYLNLRVPDDKEIIHVFDNGVGFDKGNNRVGYQVFIGRPQLAIRLAAALTAIDTLDFYYPRQYRLGTTSLLHYLGLTSEYRFRYPLLMFADSKTIYTSQGDGQCADQLNDTWAQRRSALTAPAYTTPTIDTAGTTSGNNHFQLGRGYLPADFSSLAGTVLDTPTPQFHGYCDYRDSTLSSTMAMVPTSQASISILVNTDYSAITLDSTPEWSARREHSTFSVGSYQTVDFNVFGIAALNAALQGAFKCGYRNSRDMDNSSPPMNDTHGSIQFLCSGDANPPYYTFDLEPAANLLRFYRRTRFPGSITGI